MIRTRNRARGGFGGASGSPVNVSAPVITGVSFVGGTLTTSNGTWDNSPTSYTYQWKMNGVNVSGATSSTYTLLLSQEDAVPSCEVTAVNAFGSASATGTSAPVARSLNWISADNPSNVNTTINQAFATTDVDVAGNKINITTLPAARVDEVSVTPVYFSTTGTLPAPLQTNTPYFINNVTGGFRVYPYDTDADFAKFGYNSQENVLIAQSHAFDIPIVLTTQGTGTHTISSNPIALTIADRTGQSNNYVETSINKGLEVKTDANGTFFETYGATARRLTFGGSAGYGNMLDFRGNKTNFGLKVQGQRYLYSLSVIKPAQNGYQSSKRCFFQPANVNAGTGVFTRSQGHGFSTGRLLDKGALSGGALPAGMPGGDVYVRAISTTTMSLHPTAADATNNTNVITYSNTGSGIFYFVDNTDIDIWPAREIMFDLNVINNDHRFSPSSVRMLNTQTDFSSQAFFSTGAGNGDWVFIGDNTFGRYWTILQVSIYIPPRSVGITCTDTGLPLTTGTYWATRSNTAAGRMRLFRNQSDAIASIGVNTNLTNCIKYSTLGSGRCVVYVNNALIFRPFNDLLTTTPNANDVRVTNDDDFGVYVSMIDYNNPSGFQHYFVGKDSLWNLMQAQTTVTAITIPNGTTSSEIRLFNAPEPHVPWKGKLYENIIGVANSDPTAIIQQSLNALKAKYGIA